MDINPHNFGMQHPLPLKIWKWIVDVYNNSSKCLFVCLCVFVFPPLVFYLTGVLINRCFN